MAGGPVFSAQRRTAQPQSLGWRQTDYLSENDLAEAPKWRCNRFRLAALILPKSFEPIRCERCIPHGVLDIAVPHVGLE